MRRFTTLVLGGLMAMALIAPGAQAQAGQSGSAAASSAAAPVANAARSCGRVAQLFNSSARNVSCRRARSVLGTFWDRLRTGRPGERQRIGRWQCILIRRYEAGKPAFRCRNGSAIATAYWRR